MPTNQPPDPSLGIDAVVEMIRSMPAPDCVPIPIDLYERVVKRLRRMEQKECRRRRTRLRKRRGW